MRLLFQLWRGLPPQLQVLLMKMIQRNRRMYRWVIFRHAAAKDRAAGSCAHLPPPELRYRVGASADAEEFIVVGKNCAHDIQSALLKIGRELGSFNRILDFGCGCARTLLQMKGLAPNTRIDAADIDADAIKWCKQHLDFATFTLSKERPPIDYEAETFDFIYAISVFTHLNEDYQFLWLEELRRITKPGGILLLTVNGLDGKPQEFVFERSYEEGLFPAWYQNAQHSKKYVFENFGKYFNVLEYFPRSMNGHQDVVMLQKQG